MAAIGLLMGMPVDDLLEEENPFKQVLYQAVVEQALKNYEHFQKNLAVQIANNMARLYRR